MALKRFQFVLLLFCGIFLSDPATTQDRQLENWQDALSWLDVVEYYEIPNTVINAVRLKDNSILYVGEYAGQHYFFNGAIFKIDEKEGKTRIESQPDWPFLENVKVNPWHLNLLDRIKALKPIDYELADNNSWEMEIAVSSLKKWKPDLTFIYAQPTPMPFISEIGLADGITVYIDNYANWLFVGQASTPENSRTPLDYPQRNRMRASLITNLEREDGIDYLAEDAKSDVYWFVDTTDMLSKALLEEIKQYLSAGISVHIFGYPTRGVNSTAHQQMNSVWCAKDRKAALQSILNYQDVAQHDCSSPVKRHIELARIIGISGAPAILGSNGRLVSGYQPASKLTKLFLPVTPPKMQIAYGNKEQDSPQITHTNWKTDAEVAHILSDVKAQVARYGYLAQGFRLNNSMLKSAKEVNWEKSDPWFQEYQRLVWSANTLESYREDRRLKETIYRASYNSGCSGGTYQKEACTAAYDATTESMEMNIAQDVYQRAQRDNNPLMAQRMSLNYEWHHTRFEKYSAQARKAGRNSSISGMLMGAASGLTGIPISELQRAQPGSGYVGNVSLPGYTPPTANENTNECDLKKLEQAVTRPFNPNRRRDLIYGGREIIDDLQNWGAWGKMGSVEGIDLRVGMREAPNGLGTPVINARARINPDESAHTVYRMSNLRGYFDIGGKQSRIFSIAIWEGDGGGEHSTVYGYNVPMNSSVKFVATELAMRWPPDNEVYCNWEL